MNISHFNNASRHFFDSLFNMDLTVDCSWPITERWFTKDIAGLKMSGKHKDSVNAHTAFHLASVSKTFTAMAYFEIVGRRKTGYS